MEAPANYARTATTGAIPNGIPVEPATYVAPSRVPIAVTGHELAAPVKNRVQWGPVIAGLAVALTLFLLLNMLGLAIGATVLRTADGAGDAGAFAGIWGAVSAILAFFLGGWVAAKTAAVGGSFGALMNGVLVAASGLLLIVWLATSGVGALFGTVGANVGDIANAASQAARQQGVTPQEAQQGVQQTAEQVETQAAQIDPNVAREAVRNGALGTFIAMLVPLIAAALGGYVGRNKAEDIATASA